MPILKRLNGDQQPNDSGDQPDIIRGRGGRPSISLAALQERIEDQFNAEMQNRQDILLDEQDDTARRQLVQEAAEYVFAVESVPLNSAEKSRLVEAAYRSLFTFGPLDLYFEDDAVTEMVIDGHDSIRIRRQQGAPERVLSHFQDPVHLARIIQRMLTSADAELLDEVPFMEVGLNLLGRPARLSMVMPPFSPVLHIDLRLHPTQAATLDGLAERGLLNPREVALLRALAQSPHGLLIVGDAAAGKTTLLDALMDALPPPDSAWLVERAAETRPPQGMTRLAALPQRSDRPGIEFAAQLDAALGQGPGMLLLDELRGDEAQPLWRALTMADPPRVLAVLRSSAEPDRLRSAFDILVRKGQPAVAQDAIRTALRERLPFMLAVQIAQGRLRLVSVSEWQQGSAGESLALVPLLQHGEWTSNRPNHPLPGLEDAGPP